MSTDASHSTHYFFNTGVTGLLLLLESVRLDKRCSWSGQCSYGVTISPPGSLFPSLMFYQLLRPTNTNAAYCFVFFNFSYFYSCLTDVLKTPDFKIILRLGFMRSMGACMLLLVSAREQHPQTRTSDPKEHGTRAICRHLTGS